MQQITTISVSKVMSSREIAELTGKEHAHVMRDIRSMLELLKKDASSFDGIYLDAYGREKPCFNLDAELTLTLVSGYDIPLRHRVVTRLAELETKPDQNVVQQTIPDFSNPAIAARAWAEQYEQREALALENKVKDAALAIAAPKAEALDRISAADGLLGLQAAGKALQQKPNKFVDWMRQNGWIYRRHGSSVNLGRADKVNAGYLTHKIKTIELPDGGEKVCEQVMVTPKGLTRLAQSFGVQPDLLGGLQ